MSGAAKNPYVQRLETLEREVAELKRIIGAIGAAFGKSTGGAELLSDEELDGDKYNDPVTKKALAAKYWTGDSFVGKRLSECSPEFLDAFAKYKGACSHMARKAYEKDPAGNTAKAKYAEYDAKDRVRALSWARRIRAGWKPPEKPAAPSFGSNGFGGGGATFGGGGGGSFGSSGGLGASRSAPQDPTSSESLEDFDDSGTDFDFGANVTPKNEEEEELPL